MFLSPNEVMIFPFVSWSLLPGVALQSDIYRKWCMKFLIPCGTDVTLSINCIMTGLNATSWNSWFVYIWLDYSFTIVISLVSRIVGEKHFRHALLILLKFLPFWIGDLSFSFSVTAFPQPIPSKYLKSVKLANLKNPVFATLHQIWLSLTIFETIYPAQFSQNVRWY